MTPTDPDRLPFEYRGDYLLFRLGEYLATAVALIALSVALGGALALITPGFAYVEIAQHVVLCGLVFLAGSIAAYYACRTERIHVQRQAESE